MTSLLTNTSAMSALQSLSSTQHSLQTIQGQISSGLRVANASDNAAYWSISTTMKSDVGALSVVTDALSLGSSTVGTGTAALNSAISILGKIKNDIVTAQSPGTNATQIQSDITAQQLSLKSIISSASFNGVNLLDGSVAGGSARFVSSFSRDSSGATSVGTISIDTSGTGTQLSGAAGSLGVTLGVASATGTAGASTSTPGGDYLADSVLGFKITSSTDFTALQTALETTIKTVVAAGAKLGAAKTTIDTQTAFVSSLSDAITSGIGSLEDTDMNVASTRLQALQTQQQLGIQSLSIANQNSQLVLRLFAS